jgi:hypothetical protein
MVSKATFYTVHQMFLHLSPHVQSSVSLTVAPGALL